MLNFQLGYLCLLLLLAPSFATAQTAQTVDTDWARFRGPTGMGTAIANTAPTKWDQESGVVWKTALPGAGASSPIVFRDRVYLTAYSGYLVPGEEGGSLEELKRHVIAHWTEKTAN